MHYHRANKNSRTKIPSTVGTCLRLQVLRYRVESGWCTAGTGYDNAVGAKPGYHGESGSCWCVTQPSWREATIVCWWVGFRIPFCCGFFLHNVGPFFWSKLFVRVKVRYRALRIYACILFLKAPSLEVESSNPAAFNAHGCTVRLPPRALPSIAGITIVP